MELKYSYITNNDISRKLKNSDEIICKCNKMTGLVGPVLTFADVIAFIKDNDIDEIIAYSSLKFEPKDEALVIQKVFVKPEYRKLGLASELINYIECNSKGFKLLNSYPHPENIPFMEMFKKNGFNQTEKKVGIGSGEVFLFSRTIDPEKAVANFEDEPYENMLKKICKILKSSKNKDISSDLT